MPESLATLLTGTVAGAAGGLVAATVMGLWRWYRGRRERADQVAYLASVIVRHRTLIYGVSGARAMDRDDERYLHYCDFYEDLKRVLKRRTSKLSFDEIEEIDGLLVRGFRDRKRKLDPEWYVERFEQAASVEWLKLEAAKGEHPIHSEISANCSIPQGSEVPS